MTVTASTYTPNTDTHAAKAADHARTHTQSIVGSVCSMAGEAFHGTGHLPAPTDLTALCDALRTWAKSQGA